MGREERARGEERGDSFSEPERKKGDLAGIMGKKPHFSRRRKGKHLEKGGGGEREEGTAKRGNAQGGSCLLLISQRKKIPQEVPRHERESKTKGL